MSNANTQPTDWSVTYGDITLDFATLPHASKMAMLKRGTAHYFGNEYNSAVLSREVSAICANHDAEVQKANRTKWDGMSTEERKVHLKAFREGRADEAQAIRASEMAEFVKDLAEGKVGVSVRGPSVDPLTAIMQRLAKARVVNILKANKIAVPKKADDKVTLGGTEYTMAQLITRQMDKPEVKTEIEREAKKVMADQAKAVKKAEGVAATDLL